ncbi:cell death regulator Aven [Rhinoraja longicauda]
MEETADRTWGRSRGRRGGGGGRSRGRGGRGARGPGERQQRPVEAERQQRPVEAERGWQGRGCRPPRGRGFPPRPPELQVDEDVVTKDLHDQPNEFSRRKIVSNWDRYKTEEKELGDIGESLRGADFNVLLSSAGDSFAQFRFAEEKEWEIEVSTSKQMSPLFVDCQSLAQTLQQLPLHLQLNVESELVQVNPPAELPQIRLKSMDDCKSKFGHFRAHTITSPTNVETIPVNIILNSTTPISERTAPASESQEPADHLDEELEFLLHLETPVSKNDVSLKGTQDMEVLYDPENVDISTDTSGAEGIDNTNSQPTETAEKLDPEVELEDWLDSMIS